MKTNKIQLLIGFLTLAAIMVTTAIPASAQRRQSERRSTESNVRSENRRERNPVQQKSTYQRDDSRQRSSGSSVNRRPEVKRDVRQKSATPPSRSDYSRSRSERQPSVSSNRSQSRNEVNIQRRSDNSYRNSGTNKSSMRNEIPRQERSRSSESYTGRNSNSSRGTDVREEKSATRPESNSRYRSSERSSSSDRSSRVNGRSGTKAKTIYKLDSDDRRYTASREYKGSSKYWSPRYHPQHTHYRNHGKDYYRNYDYRSYNHWNHHWENYRWNLSSWVDYYNGYHPYSYRFHRHYYHHPGFGHVIRRFEHRPVVFFHGPHRYYCHDGHFFRYRRGVGYVLATMPFGVVFDYLPHNYERVYINGYLYFRVGNLFFEHSDLGFRLVHYPERYYAYSDDYYIEGYYFEDYY